MCGIVGAIAQSNITPVLVNGLKRLEYRGYDSADIAVIDEAGEVQRRRALGKVAELEAVIKEAPAQGNIGITHTRWATHGAPGVENAHPHMSGERLAIVHNGIIENHAELKAELQAEGFVFDYPLVFQKSLFFMFCEQQIIAIQLKQLVVHALKHGRFYWVRNMSF